eukprot:scaffold819_cov239-Pinguiococcus_pyrenoidosus.AAC.5
MLHTYLRAQESLQLLNQSRALILLRRRHLPPSICPCHSLPKPDRVRISSPVQVAVAFGAHSRLKADRAPQRSSRLLVPEKELGGAREALQHARGAQTRVGAADPLVAPWRAEVALHPDAPLTAVAHTTVEALLLLLRD